MNNKLSSIGLALFTLVAACPEFILTLANEAAEPVSLEDQLKKKKAEFKNLIETIDKGGQLQTEEQTKQIDELKNEIQILTQRRQREIDAENIANVNFQGLMGIGNMGSAVAGDENEGGSREATGGAGGTEGEIVNHGPAWQNDPRLGYNHIGEYMLEIRNFCQNGTPTDKLKYVMNQGDAGFSAEHGFATPRGFLNNPQNNSGVHTTTDAGSGGLLVQSQTLDQLFMLDGSEENALFGDMQTSRVPMAAPVVKVPYLRDKDHRHGLFGGVIVTDKPDTACLERLSRLNFGKLEMQVGGTYALGAFHELLLSTSPISLKMLFEQGVAKAMRWNQIENRLYGSQTGHYGGMFSPTNPSLITIGRKNPGTGTIAHQDLLNMIIHCYGYGGAIWGASTDMITELWNLQLVIKDREFFRFDVNTKTGVLFGRPIHFNDEFFDANALVLFNSGHYLEGQFQADEFGENPYLLWLCETKLFKVTRRDVGKSWWECPLVPKRTQKPKSPFIQLGDADNFPACPELDEVYTISSNAATFGVSAQTAVAQASKAAGTAIEGNELPLADRLAALTKAEIGVQLTSREIEFDPKAKKADLIEALVQHEASKAETKPAK